MNSSDKNCEWNLAIEGGGMMTGLRQASQLRIAD
jgi:hypothetical protein